MGSSCQNLIPGNSYCVQTPDFVDPDPYGDCGVSGNEITSAASSAAVMSQSTGSQQPSSMGNSPPAPTQSGQPVSCSKWYVPKTGDTCANAESAGPCTDAQLTFHQWNPAVSSDCSTGFRVGEAYCVAA